MKSLKEHAILEDEDQAPRPIRAVFEFYGQHTMTMDLERIPRLGEIVGLDRKEGDCTFGRIKEIVWLHNLGSPAPYLNDPNWTPDNDCDRAQMFIYLDKTQLLDERLGHFE